MEPGEFTGGIRRIISDDEKYDRKIKDPFFVSNYCFFCLMVAAHPPKFPTQGKKVRFISVLMNRLNL